jgi:hypothetical protein
VEDAEFSLIHPSKLSSIYTRMRGELKYFIKTTTYILPLSDASSVPLCDLLKEK